MVYCISWNTQLKACVRFYVELLLIRLIMWDFCIKHFLLELFCGHGLWDVISSEKQISQFLSAFFADITRIPEMVFLLGTILSRLSMYLTIKSLKSKTHTFDFTSVDNWFAFHFSAGLLQCSGCLILLFHYVFMHRRRNKNDVVKKT